VEVCADYTEYEVGIKYEENRHYRHCTFVNSKEEFDTLSDKNTDELYIVDQIEIKNECRANHTNKNNIWYFVDVTDIKKNHNTMILKQSEILLCFLMLAILIPCRHNISEIKKSILVFPIIFVGRINELLGFHIFALTLSILCATLLILRIKKII
jgi:hypothetical protein